VDATNIHVRCEGREVILEGTVEDRRAKKLAEDTAESVHGVRDVQNRLRIGDPHDQQSPPA
jgi:osmotically-inducible protein OsmY